MSQERLELLREAFPYIQRFKGKIFVIKLSGKVTERPDVLRSLAEEIALCYQVGIRIVLVHGGGNQLTDLARRLGVEQKMIAGRRVTDDDTLEMAKMVFAGKISLDVVAALHRLRIPSVGLSGLDGGLIRARKRLPERLRGPETGCEETVDYGHVGDIETINRHLLTLLLENHYVPIVCCLGADDQGNILNINADTIAAEIALNLEAEKLILLSDVDGIFLDIKDPSSKVSHLSAHQMNDLLKENRLSDGMIPKGAAIIRLIHSGKTSVHVVNGLKRNALLQEIFTDEGSGTMISPGG